MKKLLLSLFIVTILFTSIAYACSPAMSQILVACTQIEPSEDNRDYIYLDDYQRYLDREKSVDMHVKTLLDSDKNCEENLTFIAENYDSIIEEWSEDRNVWSSSLIITEELNPKRYQERRYLEFEDELLNCRTYKTKEVGELTIFNYDTKDYCFSAPSYCGPSYHINPLKLFFHNLLNPSWMGLLYNIIILGVLGGLGFGLFKLFKNNTARILLKPHWINVLFAIIPTLPLILYVAMIFGVFVSLLTLLGLLILNYFLGSLIKIAIKHVGFKEFLGINKATIPVYTLFYVILMFMYFFQNTSIGRMLSGPYVIFWIIFFIYWHYIISLIVYGIKKKYKQDN